MKKAKIGWIIVSTVGLLGLAATSPAIPPEKDPGQRQEQPQKPEPFHGKVAAVDPAARTLKVDDQLIYITEATKLTHNGKPIKLGDITVGERVHGLASLSFDGKRQATTVKVGPPAKGKKNPPKDERLKD